MKIVMMTLALAVSMTFAFVIVGGLPQTSDAGCADTDIDGICDVDDNCSSTSNAPQIDSNSDGYGNSCDCDFNNDGICGGPDLTILKTFFNLSVGQPGYNPDTDLNADNVTGGPDLTRLKQLFNAPPGPSGLSCSNITPVTPCT